MNSKIKKVKLKKLKEYKKIKIDLDKRIDELKDSLSRNKDLNKNQLVILQLQLDTLKHHRVLLQTEIDKLEILKGRNKMKLYKAFDKNDYYQGFWSSNLKNVISDFEISCLPENYELNDIIEIRCLDIFDINMDKYKQLGDIYFDKLSKPIKHFCLTEKYFPNPDANSLEPKIETYWKEIK